MTMFELLNKLLFNCPPIVECRWPDTAHVIVETLDGKRYDVGGVAFSGGNKFILMTTDAKDINV